MYPRDLEGKKNFIITNSHEFSKFENIEIFKILKKNNIKYSENSNGVFVNLNYISELIINKIMHFITFCLSNKETLKDEIFKRDMFKKLVSDNHINLIPSNINFDNNLDNNNSLESGFSYNTESNNDNNETYYKENTFIIPSI